MSRILVVTEELDQLSKQFTKFTNELQNMDQNLHRTLSGVNWESKYRRDIEQKWDTLRKASNNIAQRTYRLSQYLKFVSQAFREADEAGRVISKPEYKKLNTNTKAPSDLSFPKNPSPGFFEFIGEKIDKSIDKTIETMNPKRIMDAIKDEYEGLKKDISQFVDEAGDFITDKYEDLTEGISDFVVGSEKFIVDKYEDAVNLVNHIKTTFENEELRKEIFTGLLEMSLGTLSAVEGSIITGASILGTGPTGGVSLLGAAGGAYVFLDGVSSISGGASRIWNAFDGDSKTSGDTANFVKNFYVGSGQHFGLSKNTSEMIYNGASIGTALWNIPKGVKGLLGSMDDIDSWKVKKNILDRIGYDSADIADMIMLKEAKFFFKDILYDYAVKLPGEFYLTGNDAEDLGKLVSQPK